MTFRAHAQKEHETSHGSTSRPRWTQVINSPDDKNLEVGGHKAYFSSERTPVMCNLVCSSMGRHVHIYDCRADMYGPCDDDAEVQHTNRRIAPDPDKPKDVITHSLYWRRTGSLHRVLFLGIYSKLKYLVFSFRLQRSRVHLSSKFANTEA